VIDCPVHCVGRCVEAFPFFLKLAKDFTDFEDFEERSGVPIHLVEGLVNFRTKMLNPKELRELSQVSDARSALAITGDWLLIATAFSACLLWPYPWVWLPAVLFVGRQQLALAILMHDGAHRRLFKNGKVNDWVGQCLLAAPLLFSMDSYKKLHLKHHLDPLVQDDPDLSLTGGYPISRASFARKVLRDLFGVSYFKFIRYFIYLASRPASSEDARAISGTVRAVRNVPLSAVIGSIIGAQLLLLGGLTALGHPLLYFGLWLLPAMTVLQVLLRIRGIAEHAGYAPNEDQRLNSRTVINPIQTFVFAPHGVNYHIEHHIYPSVPYFKLPDVHRAMKSRGSLPEANVYPGYGKVLAELVRR
jgi:fatty acid desaturase